MADAAEPNPTLARRILAVRLHNLREQHGHDLPWLARTLKVALSQASRLDTGARGFGLSQVKHLCQEYQLPPVQGQELVALAEEARKRGWWQQVDLPSSYRTLIGLEQGATEIAEFSSDVVPGLLQIPEYAEAVARFSGLGISESVIKQAVAVRMRRKRLFDRPSPPDLAVVFDESVLARGPETDIMRAQLNHLLSVSEGVNVRIQVVPFERGLYPIGDGHYILLRMVGGLPDIYYAENQITTWDTDLAEKVKEARALWNAVQGLALSTRASSELIAEYLRRL